MEGYNRVFRLMLMTHRAGAALASAQHTFATNGPTMEEDTNAVRQSRHRAVAAFRHDMQHCVGVLREFFSRQVLEISWAEVEGPILASQRGNVNAVPDMQGLIDLHGRYVAATPPTSPECLTRPCSSTTPTGRTCCA